MCPTFSLFELRLLMHTKQTTTTDAETTTRITPRPDAHACGVLGCGSDDDLAAVDGDHGTRTLCEYHRRAYLGWKL